MSAQTPRTVIAASLKRWREAVPRATIKDLDKQIEMERQLATLPLRLGGKKAEPATEDEILRRAAMSLINARDDIIDKLSDHLAEEGGDLLKLTGGTQEVMVIPDVEPSPFTVTVFSPLGTSTFRMEATRVEVKVDKPAKEGE